MYFINYYLKSFIFSFKVLRKQKTETSVFWANLDKKVKKTTKSQKILKKGSRWRHNLNVKPLPAFGIKSQS